MDISKLTAAPEVSSSIFEIAKRSMDAQQQWIESMKPAMELQSRYDEVSKLINPSALFTAQIDGFSQIAKEIAGQANLWKQYTQPLSAIRDSLLLTNQFSKAIELSGLSSGWQEKMRELASPLSIHSSMMRMSEEVSKQLAAISSINSERFSELAEPYKGLLGAVNSNTAYAKTIKEITEQHDWMKGIQLPVIDSATATAIAAIWGHAGVMRQLQFFGIEYQQFFTEDESENTQGLQQFKIPPIDFWTAISILLAIMTFIYQVRDSTQTENRLVSEMQLSRAEARKGTERIGQLLQTLIDARQPQEEGKIQFAVRSRVATIRKSPLSGSGVIAEIFPNQVVTLLDEDGKWIEVEYFDWIKQEFRTGWTLKKYLIRVPTSLQHPQ